jgi:hypothetical protein
MPALEGAGALAFCGTPEHFAEKGNFIPKTFPQRLKPTKQN